ncbi:hypothetical protein GCM10017557_40360 [Streptomyces aurantiacus]|uniref:Uncharacterized protein n=1 Tax=Streptomyces aurantiacus TaxID=47760 RepID=A0A7G1P5T4_9ACTN|nr:hypothetical protein GCM10017557_40360 [Streptomyces aurantiacus]
MSRARLPARSRGACVTPPHGLTRAPGAHRQRDRTPPESPLPTRLSGAAPNGHGQSWAVVAATAGAVVRVRVTTTTTTTNDHGRGYGDPCVSRVGSQAEEEVISGSHQRNVRMRMAWRSRAVFARRG